MKWILFTGTWRLTNTEVEHDVRQAVRNVLASGCGIVTGGAAGVDYFVIDECIKQSCLHKLRVFIPSTLEHYIEDYHHMWCHAPVTHDDIHALEAVLQTLKQENPSGLLEMKHVGGEITQEHYDLRHNEEVMFSDEVYAFQVNNSTGTQDTIDRAKEAGLGIGLHKTYSL